HHFAHDDASTPDIGHFDLLPRARRRLAAQLRITIAAHVPDRRQFVGDHVVAGAAAQQPLEVEATTREQAGIERAFGRQAGARTAAAEGLGDRRYDADFAAAVAIPPAAGDLARVIRCLWLDRPARTDAARDFIRRDHVVQ